MLTWIEITIYTTYVVFPEYLKHPVKGGLFLIYCIIFYWSKGLPFVTHQLTLASHTIQYGDEIAVKNSNLFPFVDTFNQFKQGDKGTTQKKAKQSIFFKNWDAFSVYKLYLP